MKRIILFVIGFSFLVVGNSQPKDISSSELLHRIEGLKTTATVLYIAAHPDDENTRLISYLTKGKHYRVAYLSLTRGEGGQNLIGDEQGVDLGILRTQELLAARKIDGGEQFFSTAYDFGYSKTPVETMEKWGRKKIIDDIIAVMNHLEPDIVICRFPTTGEGGHGHHTASAMLAEEAFDTLVKRNGKYVPKKLFWNTFNFGNRNTTSEDQLKIDVGGYNALLGKSYGEIAAEARSMHRCQAFGSERRRGEQFEYFKTLRDNTPKLGSTGALDRGLMEGIISDWSRFKGGEVINKKIEEIIKAFKLSDPSSSVKELLILRGQIDKLSKENFNCKIISKRLIELDELILDCAGFYIELTNKSAELSVQDSMRVKVYAVNRGKIKVSLQKIVNEGYADFKAELNSDLVSNTLLVKSFSTYIPNDLHAFSSFPYPVYDERLGYIHRSDTIVKGNPILNYLPEFRPETDMQIHLKINDVPLVIHRQLKYKYIDPSFGEIFQPVVFSPVADIKFEKDLYVGRRSDTLGIELKFESKAKSPDFEIHFGKPEYFKITPEIVSGDECQDKEFRNCDFKLELTTSKKHSNDTVLAESFYSTHEIKYDHIPLQTVYSSSQTVVVFDDFKTQAKKIGYIEGAGDKIPDVLKQLGYEVVILNESNISTFELSTFDCIVTGVRAYNTQKWLGDFNDKFLKYVGDGGNFLIQYNTSNGLVSEIFKPFNLKLSRDRVTEEESKVTILDSTVAILNYPNKIRENDFENWVQEYGLYFPVPEDFNYMNLFSMNDTGENPNKNSTLYCKFGKGKYVYTGLSFFRELPAGVPGAIKLFINLMEKNTEEFSTSPSIRVGIQDSNLDKDKNQKSKNK